MRLSRWMRCAGSTFQVMSSDQAQAGWPRDKAKRSGGASLKARRLAPRPFPLLEDGQDPGDLSAKVAFHLHRLRLTGKRLRDCGFVPGYQVRELAQARLRLAIHDVEKLASCMDVPVVELARDLTVREAEIWSFYRASARQAGKVWARARVAWERQHLSVREAALIMGLDRTVVARNTQPHRRRGYKVFPFDAAERLAIALVQAKGPSFLLDDDDCPTQVGTDQF